MRILREGAVNVSTRQRLAERVLRAETLLERLRGLLGRSSLSEEEALLLDPCRAIHTVGMRFPIDVLFLDRRGRVVRAVERLRPNRLMEAAWGARRALELPAGRIQATGTSVGHQIQLQVEPVTGQPSAVGRWLLNIFLGLLFASLASMNLHYLLSSATVSGAFLFRGALLFLVNALFAVLFLIRRRATRVSDRPTDWAITLSTVLIVWGLRPGPPSPWPLSLPGHLLQGLGLILIPLSLISLGRSFGLIPADRGLVIRGPYRWMRHPMYTGEMLFYLGFGLVNPSARNLVLVAGLFLGLSLRALAEERLLGSDPRYRAYRERVSSRFFPLIL
jgi:protein-S-isoprenylcysteine O-methyltransferase Ste14/uncharacterized membrane protein (UPF0127 family)